MNYSVYKNQQLKSPDGMTLTFRDVTPKVAAGWLEKNGANRRLRATAVDAYAKDMAAGNWRIIPHAICFAPDGVLLNGQHTLRALIKANMSVWLLVATDVAIETAAVMDSGRIRTIADQLHLIGSDTDPRALRLARYVRAGIKYVKDKSNLLFNGALAEYAEHRDAIDHTLGFIRPGINRRGWGLAFLTVVTRAYYTADKTRLAEFMSIVTDGMATGSDDSSALRLRDYMLSGQHAGSSRQLPLYEKTQSALRAFLVRQPLAKLYGMDTEVFQVPA